MEVECSSSRNPDRRRSRRPARPGRRTSFSATINVVGFALALIASIASGQDSVHLPNRQTGPQPLPPVSAADGVEPGRTMPEALISFDRQIESFSEGSSGGPRNRAMELVERRAEYEVRGYGEGFFQRLQFSGGWIDATGGQDLEIGDLETSLTVAVPLGSFENLLIVTSGFEVDALNSSASAEVPSPLYDVGVDFMWRKQFNDRWGLMVAARPAISSDFKTSQDGFRMTGRALATWQWIPERLSLLFGVVYLDRNDLPVLPGAGLIWTPNPDWRLDLIFPRPKLARRLLFVPRRREDWLYLSGSLGGQTWAVERFPGISDQLTLRDYRLSFGWERIRDGGGGLFAEIGYVFGRELEYENSPASESFSDAGMIRAGVTF